MALTMTGIVTYARAASGTSNTLMHAALCQTGNLFAIESGRHCWHLPLAPELGLGSDV